MALSVLDGNQTATTLSSVVTGGEHIVAHSVVSLGSNAIANITSAVSGSVVSVSNFPATQTIAGTVTANVGNVAIDGDANLLVSLQAGTSPYTQPISGTVTVGNSVNIGSLPAISGTVTANVSNLIREDYDALGFYGVPAMGKNPDNDTYKIFKTDQDGILSISGTVTANLDNNNFGAALTDYVEATSSHNAFPVEIQYQPSVTIGSLPAISGTVTVGAMPNGALTTCFGSVTTANTALASSAVTNANRKYLLIQNVTTGSNVITVGIGFTPTTTQGIQLTAGAGITFESSYIPTGAVYVLSSVTASNFTILEA
jgi:hypothetical protein